MNLRRFCSFLCCLSLLVLSAPSSALASTGSKATPGNAVMSPGIQDAIDEIQPYAEMPGDIGGSTAGLSNITVLLFYKTTTGQSRSVRKTLDSKGYFSFSKPSDFDMISNLEFYLESTLPPPGKYQMKVAFASNTGGFSWNKGLAWSDKSYSNAAGLSGSVAMSLSQFSGDFTATANLDIGNPSRFTFVVYPDGNFAFPFGGYLSVRYQRLLSNAETSGSTAGGATTPQEQVVDKVDSIGSQLSEGFDGIIGAVTGVGDTISGAMGQASDEITENANQNSQAQIDAMEENTNIITGAISALGDFIINGLKGLFIPSDDFFKGWFDDIYAFFETRLGFLMVPLDFLLRLLDIFTGGASFTGIPFPEFKWLDGTVIIPAQTVTFTFLETEWGKEIQEMLYFIGNVILTGALLSLMHRKLEEVLRG